MQNEMKEMKNEDNNVYNIIPEKKYQKEAKDSKLKASNDKDKESKDIKEYSKANKRLNPKDKNKKDCLIF